MANLSGSGDVLVIGGGVIGLSLAWRARERGMSVTVLERDTLGSGTSQVAAGMLAPVAEVEFGEAGRRVLELGLRSAELWPSFAEQLQAGSGIDVGLLRTGTLVLARDEDEARELERQVAFRDGLGLATSRLRGSEAREREPALAPSTRLALEAPDDHSVDPRAVLAALRVACESAGVQLREHARVERVQADAGRVAGVTLAGGQSLAAGQVVLAAGAWSAQIAGAELAGARPGATVPVRPVRGQLLRLRDPAGPGLLSRVIRFEGGYVVPRADGRYVLGASVEERGFDVEPDVGGVYELLREAHEVVPGISELKIEELCVGLRPGMPDNAPAIGPGSPEGLLLATGHHRNGILLAPLTAQLGAKLLCGEQIDASERALLDACDPRRFVGSSAEQPAVAEAVHA
jgi:glycine oxidase